MPGVPALSTSGGIPSSFAGAVSPNPLAQIGDALAQLPQQMALQQSNMQQLGQQALAPLNAMLAANPALGDPGPFMDHYVQVAKRYGIYVPLKQQGAPGVGASGMPGTTTAPLPGSPAATGTAPTTQATPTQSGDSALSIGARTPPVAAGGNAVPGEGGALPAPLPGSGGAIPATAQSQQNGGQWGLDVNAIIGKPKKTVADLSPADQQYFMSLQSGDARMKAAIAFGIGGITPEFINAPMQPRSAAEVDEFSKEYEQERARVAAGTETPDELVSFANQNGDRLQWLGIDKNQVVADKGLMGQMTFAMKNKLQQLANQGLISKSDMVRAEADASKATTAAQLAVVQEQYIGAKISVLPQEVQAKMETAAAAMQNSQAHAQEVAQHIQDSVQGTWAQHATAQAAQQRIAIQKSGIHQWTAILNDDQKNYNALLGQVNSLRANKQDPSAVLINIPDPANPGQTKQVTVGDALQAAQAQVAEDRKQLIATAAKNFVTQETAPQQSSGYQEGQVYKDGNGKQWTYAGQNPDGSPIWTPAP
jgi:hypothetical protein